METKIKNNTDQDLSVLDAVDRVKALMDIKNLLADLNQSLVELEEEKENYDKQISECKGLCHQIREIMNATSQRIISPPAKH